MIDVVVATAEEKGGAPGPGGAWRGGRAGGKGSRRWKGGADARQGNGCVGVLRDKKGGGGDPAVATGVNKRGRQGYGRCPRIGGPHRPLRRRCAPPSPTGRPTLAGDDDCNGCRPPLPRPPPPPLLPSARARARRRRRCTPGMEMCVRTPHPAHTALPTSKSSDEGCPVPRRRATHPGRNPLSGARGPAGVPPPPTHSTRTHRVPGGTD